MKRTIIAIILALASSTAAAEFYTTRQIYALMTGDSGDRLIAMGYVAGVFDVHVHVKFCTPGNVKLGTVYNIVVGHIASRPSEWNRDAYAVITEGLQASFPACRPSAPASPYLPGFGT